MILSNMFRRAIDYFSEKIWRDDISLEESHFTHQAIMALQKQEPMHVNHERTFWRYTHYCPDCQEQLKIEALKYCNNCGQRLDWSNYELGLKYVR
jgi:hypothetical protein